MKCKVRCNNPVWKGTSGSPRARSYTCLLLSSFPFAACHRRDRRAIGVPAVARDAEAELRTEYSGERDKREQWRLLSAPRRSWGWAQDAERGVFLFHAAVFGGPDLWRAGADAFEIILVVLCTRGDQLRARRQGYAPALMLLYLTTAPPPQDALGSAESSRSPRTPSLLGTYSASFTLARNAIQMSPKLVCQHWSTTATKASSRSASRAAVWRSANGQVRLTQSPGSAFFRCGSITSTTVIGHSVKQ